MTEMINENINVKTEKKLLDKLIPVLTIVLVILVVMLCIFAFSGKNIAKRLLSRGDIALSKGNAEEAYNLYIKALSKDRDNALISYKAVNTALELSNGEALSLFDEALKQAENADNKAQYLDLFLLAPEITDDSGERLELVRKCYELSGESKELGTMLTDALLYHAGNIRDTDMDSALILISKAYELSDGAETVLEVANKYVTMAIDAAISSGDTTRAYELLNKNSDMLKMGFTEDGKSFYDDLMERVDAFSEWADSKDRLMAEVFGAMYTYYCDSKDGFSIAEYNSSITIDFGMLAADWSIMNALDNSQEARDLAMSHVADRYIYLPFDSFGTNTGEGAGMYVSYQEDGNAYYSFYMGDYVAGERAGYGILFIGTGEDTYYSYEGNWSEDAPNGEGVFYKNSVYSDGSNVKFLSVTLGNFTDGIEDGLMFVKAVSSDSPKSFLLSSYEVKDGVAAEIDYVTPDYSVMEKSGAKLIAVLIDTIYGYGYCMPLYQYENTVLGIPGFY